MSIELDIAERLAKAAGKVALAHAHDGNITEKPNNEGPVSPGDRLADELIRQGLSEAFPDDTLISEENYHAGDVIPSSGRVWFIDPIDGTNDYIKGGSEYAVMIGLAIDAKPVLGVVYQPATGILWRAANGVAERVDADGCVRILKITVNSETRLLISRYHPSAIMEKIIASGHFSQIIQMSSVGLKLAAIAQGDADLYINLSRRLKLWDTCGPVAILQAAGGFIQAIDSREIKWCDQIEHGTGLIFSSHAQIPELTQLVPNVRQSPNR